MRKLVTYHGISATIPQWSRFLDVDYYTLAARLRRGWPVQRALEEPVHHHNSAGRKTHGLTGTKEHRAWKAMLGRCRYRGYWAWHRYGGRGISVCDRWRNDFQAFLQDVGPAPSPAHSLGRLQNDGNYEPGNVSWQNASQQAANRAKPSRCL